MKTKDKLLIAAFVVILLILLIVGLVTADLSEDIVPESPEIGEVYGRNEKI